MVHKIPPRSAPIQFFPAETDQQFSAGPVLTVRSGGRSQDIVLGNT